MSARTRKCGECRAYRVDGCDYHTIRICGITREDMKGNYTCTLPVPTCRSCPFYFHVTSCEGKCRVTGRLVSCNDACLDPDACTEAMLRCLATGDYREEAE